MYYEDLPDNAGFQRITPCSNIDSWNPVAMIDKHRPTKLGVDGLLTLLVLYNAKFWRKSSKLEY